MFKESSKNGGHFFFFYDEVYFEKCKTSISGFKGSSEGISSDLMISTDSHSSKSSSFVK